MRATANGNNIVRSRPAKPRERRRQRRWLAHEQNRDYFCGSEQVQRVREWRAAHPGYWRGHRRAGKDALEDALNAQPHDLNAVIDHSAETALHDALRCQGPILIGLIAHLSDSAPTSRPPAAACYNSAKTSWAGSEAMRITRVLRPEALRRIPRQFSWIDQRLVSDHPIERCDEAVLAVYLFLVTVADAQGLNYYGDAKLDTHPCSSQQIFQRLREVGYSGSLTLIKDYVRTIRPAQQKSFLKLSFARAECAPVDWGEYGMIAVGSTRRKLSFFVMVLCYSRQMYLEFTVSPRACTSEPFLTPRF